MQPHAWWLLLAALVALCCMLSGGERMFAQAKDLDNDSPSSVSLCGENLTKETGIINGLYYVFYESSSRRVDAPVILWLSGGPGCSGLVALLFENGPCSFDDEANAIAFNPYSWTGLAHVIYLDQPKGTGYSDGDHGITQPWSLGGAAETMHAFLQEFFIQHQALKANAFYIFGESYAGHYVPDLAVKMLDDDDSLPTLKGIGIGNGVVSTTAWAESIIPFLKANEHGYDFLGASGNVLQFYLDHFRSAITSCRGEDNLRHSPDRISANCAEALQRLTDMEVEAASAVTNLGRNVYDVRRECHRNDGLGLCYRFARLQTFVNSLNVRAYFNEAPHQWNMCSSGALSELAAIDKLEESEANVARALEHGVRVLVYGGDADTVVNWMSQDSWTRDLSWRNHDAFNSAAFQDQTFQGQLIGRVRTLHGLSFMKVSDAGHVRRLRLPAFSSTNLLLTSRCV
ncbi:unnamed protein product [Phytophthora lilii]|uniref:Carboxypeptidase n=1 Tax=Phytophthora lilii TaxID=2077276 RepID=A0A9W6YEN5_9STRA|nr:unnamed protein product [Phytophthora lilii]